MAKLPFDLRYSDMQFKATIISINRLNITEHKLKKVSISDSIYEPSIEYVLTFEDGEKKLFKHSKFELPMSIRDWLVYQLKNELPYMDRKMRSLYG